MYAEAVQDVSSDSSVVELTGEFGAFSPLELFDHWVRPELLVLWWPREATVDPRVGGEYRFTWPEQGWVLVGTYTAFEPGRALGFTWKWNHDATDEPLQVDLRFEPLDKGTRLRVRHGTWGSSKAEQEDRHGVLEGWIHFGMRLAGLREGPAT